MDTVTFSEVDNKLKEVIDKVSSDTDCTILKTPGSKDAVIMSRQYYNSLIETAHLLSSAANAAHLRESIAQHKSGQVFERDIIED